MKKIKTASYTEKIAAMSFRQRQKSISKGVKNLNLQDMKIDFGQGKKHPFFTVFFNMDGNYLTKTFTMSKTPSSDNTDKEIVREVRRWVKKKRLEKADS
jgi:hypothetical protein|tara:strand:+ start:195 stop:491 length:297 start_codon:yes stop_codon:yes gene_type:complete